MTCCLCERVALRHVGNRGFCRKHMDAAVRASRAETVRLSSMVEAERGHRGNFPKNGRSPRGAVRLTQKNGYGRYVAGRRS